MFDNFGNKTKLMFVINAKSNKPRKNDFLTVITIACGMCQVYKQTEVRMIFYGLWHVQTSLRTQFRGVIDIFCKFLEH